MFPYTQSEPGHMSAFYRSTQLAPAYLVLITTIPIPRPGLCFVFIYGASINSNMDKSTRSIAHWRRF